MLSYPRICLIDVIKKESVADGMALHLILLANYLSFKNIVPKENFLVLNSFCDDVPAEITKFKPDIIGFSAMTPYYDFAVNLASKLRKLSDGLFVIGGYHISALPEQFGKPFDIGVLGEGEYTLAKLVELWKQNKIGNTNILSNVLGIVFLDSNNRVVITGKQKLVDTNDLPMVDMSILPERKVARYVTLPINGKVEIRKFAEMYTARGCPYNCAFCAHRIMTGGKSGVRYFPINRVLDEMEYLYNKYKINCIQILDDTFAVSKSRLRLMIDGMKKRKLLGKICFYTVFVRANIIDQEFSNLLKELGTTVVFIGIESGSTNILKIIKDGPLSAEIVKKAVLCFEKNDIYVLGSFMIFSPGEEKKDIQKSIDLASWFADRKNAYGLGISVTTPYPGTKLWLDAQNTDIFKNIAWGEFKIFYSDKVKKMPRIFYQPKWATEEEKYYYWKCFTNKAGEIREKVKSIKNWKALDFEMEMRNKYMDKKWKIEKRMLEYIDKIIVFITSQRIFLFNFIKRRV